MTYKKLKDMIKLFVFIAKNDIFEKKKDLKSVI